MFEMVNFKHFNWLGISMEPEYAVDKIIHGILLDKKVIYIPRLLLTICSVFKGYNNRGVNSIILKYTLLRFSFTEFTDHAVSVLAMNASGEKKKNF
jgi:hypothetical protein